jgi:uncharacterized protein (TIGR03083 family)
VRNEFAAANEPWVAVRRTRSGEAVRAEFVAVNGRRLVVLDALAEEDWARVGPSVVGDVAYAEFLRVRVFDSWVHEQDVRLALRRPGGSGGQASRLAIGRVQSAMGFVVGKKSGGSRGHGGALLGDRASRRRAPVRHRRGGWAGGPGGR